MALIRGQPLSRAAPLQSLAGQHWTYRRNSLKKLIIIFQSYVGRDGRVEGDYRRSWGMWICSKYIVWNSQRINKNMKNEYGWSRNMLLDFGMDFRMLNICFLMFDIKSEMLKVHGAFVFCREEILPAVEWRGEFLSRDWKYDGNTYWKMWRASLSLHTWMNTWEKAQKHQVLTHLGLPVLMPCSHPPQFVSWVCEVLTQIRDFFAC